MGSALARTAAALLIISAAVLALPAFQLGSFRAASGDGESLRQAKRQEALCRRGIDLWVEMERRPSPAVADELARLWRQIASERLAYLDARLARGELTDVEAAERALRRSQTPPPMPSASDR